MPKEIAHEFGNLYSSLYNLFSPFLPPSAIEEYLSSAHLSHLPSPVRQDLEAPISIGELQEVGATKTEKAPGPDGFSILYYKTLLGSHMLKVFNALGQSTSFPPATLLAHISVIPKEGKDPSVCGSY